MTRLYRTLISSGSSALLPAIVLAMSSAGCLDASPDGEAAAAQDVSVAALSPMDALRSLQLHTSGINDGSQLRTSQQITDATNNVVFVPCRGPYRFHAKGTDRFVSAELGYSGGDSGMLRARATQIGPWELFDLCFDSAAGSTLIRSEANGLLVSAEFGYTGGDNGMLRARAAVGGAWEHFRLSIHSDDNFYTLENAGNSILVSAEFGYTGGDNGMLRDRAWAIGPWEQFD
jgi:hypothetical protein